MKGRMVIGSLGLLAVLLGMPGCQNHPSGAPPANNAATNQPSPSTGGGGTPPPPSSGGGGTQPSPTPPAGETLQSTAPFNKLVTLKVSAPDGASESGVTSNTLVAGVADGATSAFDNAYDVPAFLAGPVQAYFDHAGEPGYDHHADQLWQDFQSKTAPLWTIAVTAGADQTVTFEWTVSTEGITCTTNHFILDDNGTSVDLCAQPQYSYRNTSSAARMLTLRVF